MKIDGNSPFIKLEGYLQKIQGKKDTDNASHTGGKQNVSGDNVLLSPKAKEIQEAKKILSTCPDIREEKVAQIKKQIEEGTYQVDSKKVAEKLIKETLLDEIL